MKLLILLLLTTPFVCSSQSMTKKEIANYLIKFQPLGNSDSLLNGMVEKDDNLNLEIKNCISYFKSSNIDTFGFFNTYSPGFTSTNSCFTGMMKSNLFLFWISNDKFYVQHFTHSCKSEKMQIEKLYGLNFFKENFFSIDSERIFPVIYSAKLDNNNIKFDGEIIMHEKKYVIYCQAKGNKKFLSFSQNDIENQKGLFYLDNISTSHFHLYKIMQAEANLWKEILPIR